jgi:hypothetical protein
MKTRDLSNAQLRAFAEQVAGKKTEPEARVETPTPFGRPAALPDLREEIRSRVGSFRAHL